MSEQGPTVFNGRYEILRHIARGGMADVYLARDELLGREVALKVMFPEFANDSNFVERFRREAQAAANLNHPNIVGIYDWGQERGTYYIVMEHVSGRSMSDVLRSTGPLHPDRAAEIAADVAAALSVAHSAGLVHRDIKLGNILVSDSGSVKVADFGIATAAASTGDPDLTQHGSVMGTATYFSPEQAQAKALDGRSDLYSLGVALYEMLAGVPPFQADTPVAVAYKHVQERPLGLRERGVNVAQSLEAITMKLLAKNPVNRYPSADDLRNDLRRYLAGAHQLPGAGAAGAAAATGATGAQPAAGATAAGQPTAMQPGIGGGAGAGVPPLGPAGFGGGPVLPGGGYYYEEPEAENSTWRTVSLLGALAVLVVILGFLFAAFVNALGGGDGDPSPDSGESLVDTPDLLGMDVEEARSVLLEANLLFDVEFAANNTVPVNQVFAQDPPSGQRVDPETVVKLTVSSGTADTVPNVIGETRDSAVAILQGLGYQVTEVSVSSPQDAGTVVAQSPASGAALATGEAVEISVSSGPELVPIPGDLEGSEIISALNTLRDLGFSVSASQIEEASEEVEAGRVIRTEPAAGTLVPAGTQVSLVVSTGLPVVIVESVRTLHVDSAVIILRDEQGLIVRTVLQDVPFGSPDENRVLSQTPVAGTEVALGSEVTITVGRALPAPTTTTTTTTTTVAP
jgi:beta-lactam-binding protein with PASTA domain/tRNA A-37 threonylcarbamoyl transferase component Bud32